MVTRRVQFPRLKLCIFDSPPAAAAQKTLGSSPGLQFTVCLHKVALTSTPSENSFRHRKFDGRGALSQNTSSSTLVTHQLSIVNRNLRIWGGAPSSPGLDAPLTLGAVRVTWHSSKRKTRVSVTCSDLIHHLVMESIDSVMRGRPRVIGSCWLEVSNTGRTGGTEADSDWLRAELNRRRSRILASCGHSRSPKSDIQAPNHQADLSGNRAVGRKPKRLHVF